MDGSACTTVDRVADYLVRFRTEHGDPITNLHLQKFLYYAQGWYLALYKQRLFEERLEAWVHGPAQPVTYGRFKHNRWNPIADEIGWPELPKKVEKHLQEVLTAYGRFSAWDLERMTHAEDPWREARGGIPDDESSKSIISAESMRRYFSERLKASAKK